MRRAMIVAAFVLALAFVVRAPEQSLGDGVRQASGNAVHFVGRMLTLEKGP